MLYVSILYSHILTQFLEHYFIITFGIQKGGVGKTTTAALSSWLLSRKSRVLAVDMDSQGNLTQVLSLRPPESFAGRTVLEAMKKR